MMDYLVYYDPDGTTCTRLIQDHKIDPKNLWVWDNLPTHRALLKVLSKKFGFTLIEETKWTNSFHLPPGEWNKLLLLGYDMKFDKILSNPPYDDSMWVKAMQQLPRLLKPGGEFQFLVPNKILTPFTKGATFAKENLSIDRIDLTYGKSFIPAIEGTWACNVVGGLGKTDKFPLTLPSGDVVETDFDSPNPVMEMDKVDFDLHHKVMRKDNKFIFHKTERIDSKYFCYMRPTPSRVDNKLRYQGIVNEFVEKDTVVGLTEKGKEIICKETKNGFYQVCKSKEQAERMLKIYTESELFRYISYCNIGFAMITRFNKEFLPNIEDCLYNSEQDVYNFFNINDEEIEHIQNVLNKSRDRHH